MITINFSNPSFTTDDKRVVVTNNGSVPIPTFAERTDVAYLSKSAYFALEFCSNMFSTGTMVLSLSFYIEKDIDDDRTLLHGDGLPLSLNLRSKQEGYRIETNLTLPEVCQSFLSADVISKEKWHDLNLFLLDGECFLTLDGKLQGRRVFTGELKYDKEWKLFFGKRLNTSVKGGFYGYLDSLTLNDTLTPEQEALASSLADDAVGEVESKLELLKKLDVDTGVQTGERVLFAPTSTCHYTLFSNGAIIWSPTYGCTWLSSRLFEAYLNAIENISIGLPMADEVGSKEYGVTYCICEAAGLFLRNGTVYTMPADFLTEYADKGLLASAYGLPDSQPFTRTLNNGSIVTFQRFTEAMFCKGCKPEEQQPTIVLPIWVAEEYLKSPDNYGVPTAYQVGYKGNILDGFVVKEYVTAGYLFTDSVTVCCNTYRIGLKAGQVMQELHKWFIPDEKIFSYFKANNGLNAVGDEPYGPYKCLIAELKTTSKNVRYHDCANGVLIHFPDDPDDKICGFTEIKIELNHIHAKKINDGTNESPELYIEVTPYRNGKAIQPEKRWPDYSARKHGGSSFDIVYEGNAVTSEHKEGDPVFYSFPRIHGADKLQLCIFPFDYDKVTKNDSLGRIDICLDIETGWGIHSDFLTPYDRVSRIDANSGTIVHYDGMYLTKSYGDNRGGRENFGLNFSISCGEVKYDLDSFFRKYGYWAVDNFKSAVSLSKAEFNKAFHANTGHWYDWILHFWDEIWFQAAKNDYDGSEGNCFGLSTEAMLSLHGAGNYRLPLNDWTPFSKSKKKAMEEWGVKYDMEKGCYFYTNEYPKKSYYNEKYNEIIKAYNNKEISEKEKDEKINDLWQERDQRYLSTSDELEKGFFDNIRERHLYQLGWDHVNMIVNLAVDRVLFSPKTSFQRIIELLRKEKYCLVNCFSPGGHTVLAYGTERVRGEDRILIADSNHPWWEDINNKNGSYLALSDDLIPKVELHYSYSNQDNIGKIYDYCYATPYKYLLRQPRVPSWLELTGFVINTILRIPEFLFKNFAEFLYVISCGETEVSFTGSDDNSFELPIFSTELPSLDGHVLRLMVVPEEETTMQLKGKDGQDYTVFISGKGKSFRLHGKLKEGGIVFETRLMSKKRGEIKLRSPKPVGGLLRSGQDELPEITELHIGVAPYGKHAKLVNRFDQSRKTVKEEKQYYLNLHRQKNGKLEIHSEDCPYLKQIKNSEYLGIHESPQTALKIAKNFTKRKVDCCRFCCRGHSTD